MIESPTSQLSEPQRGGNVLGEWDRSQTIRASLAAASGFVMVLTLWATWFRVLGSSGNSFRMFNTADLLGLDEVTPFRVFWFLIPVLYLLCLVGNAAQKFRSAGALQVVISLPVLIVAAALLYVGLGAWGAGAATIAALSSIVASAVLILGVSRRD